MHIKKKKTNLLKLDETLCLLTKPCSSAAGSKVLNASKYEVYNTKHPFTSVKSEIKKAIAQMK